MLLLLQTMFINISPDKGKENLNFQLIGGTADVSVRKRQAGGMGVRPVSTICLQQRKNARQIPQDGFLSEDFPAQWNAGEISIQQNRFDIFVADDASSENTIFGQLHTSAGPVWRNAWKTLLLIKMPSPAPRW